MYWILSLYVECYGFPYFLCELIHDAFHALSGCLV